MWYTQNIYLLTYLFGLLIFSCPYISISFPRFGKFSALFLSSTFSTLLIFISTLSMLWIRVSGPLIQELLYTLVTFIYFLLIDVLICIIFLLCILFLTFFFSWISALVLHSTVFLFLFFNLFISNIFLLNNFKLLRKFLYHIAGFPCAFLTFKSTTWIDCFFNYLFIFFFRSLKSFIIFGSRSLTWYISKILVSLDLLIEKLWFLGRLWLSCFFMAFFLSVCSNL